MNNGKSLNIVDDKIAQLKKIIPEAFAENKIDWEKLKISLGENIDLNDERYHLNWAGKSDAFRTLQTQTTATLVADKSESIDFDNTENVFIEGENLEVLKVLQKSYFGKIKMIYIDPPYNTGNDFVYSDKFKEDRQKYEEKAGIKDDHGFLNREGLVKNTKDRGHYHSAWLSMMYPRLFLAKNLLRDDGVIFISIDDNEVHNLRMLMNEIFGEENFVAQFPWRKRTAKSDVAFGVSQDYEWLLCIAKSDLFIAGIENNKRKYYESPDLPNNPWRIHDMTTQRTALERPNSDFTMVNPKTGKEYPVNPNAVWRVTKETFKEFYDKNRIVFPDDYDFLNISNPVLRYFKSDDEKKAGKMFGYIPVSTHFPKNIGMTQNGTKDIANLFKNKIFSFPKPLTLIQYILKAATSIDRSVIILDFFSGSGTTAQAVLDLNKKDGGNRKFICVQMPEKCDEKSEAFKAGYKTIADIAKERIRRVIDKIKSPSLPLGKGELTKNDDCKQQELSIESDSTQSTQNTSSADAGIDLGFKVFKLQPSNFKIWRADKIKSDEDLEKELKLHIDPIIPDAKTEDILYELLLKSGEELTAKIEKKDGIYFVNEKEIALILEKIDSESIKKVIEEKPRKLITLDKLFSDNDQLKTNTVLQMKDAEIDFKVV